MFGVTCSRGTRRDMNQKIEQHWAQFEAVKAEFVELTEGLGPERRHWAPDSATWSALQIVEHLVLAEESVGRPDAGAVHRPVAFPFWLVPRPLLRRFILRALNNDVALPLPAPGLDPTGLVPFDQLLARWATVRDTAREAIETHSERARLYWHPVLGAIDALAMLELANCHHAYHLRQLKRLLQLPECPL